jgi:hypothetical protein
VSAVPDPNFRRPLNKGATKPAGDRLAAPKAPNRKGHK